MNHGLMLETKGPLERALTTFVADKKWDDAVRTAMSLNRPGEAGRYCLLAQRPWDAAVCFQRAGSSSECLSALLQVAPTSNRYPDACAHAIRVARSLGKPLEELFSHLLPFSRHSPSTPAQADALKELAEAFDKAGKLPLASSIYRAILQVFPQDPEARERLARPRKPRLNELLLARGLVSAAQLERLIKRQPEAGQSEAVLREALVIDNVVSECDLIRVLSESTDIGWISDEELLRTATPEAARLLSLDFTHQWKVAPIKVVDRQHHRQLHVAMHDPRDIALVDKLRFTTGLSIVGLFGTASGIRRAVGKLYRGEDPSLYEATSWQGGVAPEPFSDRYTGTREHQFDTSEFQQPAPLPARTPVTVDAPRPGVGTRVAGRYQLEALIGEGGSASVYRALDLELNERIALKLFAPASAAQSEMMVARFKLELSLSRLVNHPNIIRLFDLGCEGRWRYLTMELLEGRDLASLLTGRGAALPLSEGLRYLEQVCSGLQAAHERGVVHRDIKPQNIFVTSRGEVKVMDFGISRIVHSRGVTVTGTVAGTPEYISPEQISGFSDVTFATDLYALGVTAYQLFTGALPFNHADLAGLLVAQTSERPRPPRELNPELPPRLELLLLKCLEKDPASRPPSAGVLGLALRSVRESLGRS